MPSLESTHEFNPPALRLHALRRYFNFAFANGLLLVRIYAGFERGRFRFIRGGS